LEVVVEAQLAFAEAMQPLVDAVKAHATKHYDDGGWDVVIECWEDWELMEFLASPWPEKPEVETPEQAIERMAGLVSVWAEKQADAEYYRQNW
jgi:hypothetical protein